MDQQDSNKTRSFSILKARLLFAIIMTAALLAVDYVGQIISLIFHRTALSSSNLAALSEDFLHHWVLVGTPIFIFGFLIMSFVIPVFNRLGRSPQTRRLNNK